MQLKTMQYLTKNQKESPDLPKSLYQCHGVFHKESISVIFAFSFCRVFGIDCLEVSDIVNVQMLVQNIPHIQFQRETGQKFGDILKMGIILIKNALKNDIGLMEKPTFLYYPIPEIPDDSEKILGTDRV